MMHVPGTMPPSGASIVVDDLVACNGVALQIVAGRGGLSRRLESVHAVYNPVYLPRISPHTLVLMMDEKPVSLKRDGLDVLRALNDLDMAGLGVGLFHRAPHSLPDAMVEEADKLAFPLITVPPDVSFQSVIQLWQQRVASSDLMSMKRLVDAHESVLDITDTDEISAILARLASMTETDTVLVNAVGHVLASCWRSTPPDVSAALTRELWIAYTRARGANRDIDCLATSRGTFHVRPIRAQGAVRQVLFAATPSRGPMSSFVESLLGFTQRVLQLDAVARLGSATTRPQERRDLLAGLRRRALNEEDVLERLQYLGFPTKPALRIIALRHQSRRRPPGATSAQPSVSRQDQSGATLKILEGAFDRHRIPYLSSTLDDTTVVAVPSANDDLESGSLLALELVRALCAESTESVPDRRLIVGVSEPAIEPLAACRGMTHAYLALERARKDGLDEVRFELLEPELRALDELPDEHLETLADGLVGVLRSREPRDAERDLRTLEAYIGHDLSVADTAAYLHMHRNTLHRRLNRLSVLLDRDLGSFKDLSSAHLALMAHDVMQARAWARSAE